MKRITEKDITDLFFGFLRDFVRTMKSVSDRTKGATKKKPAYVGGRAVHLPLDIWYDNYLDTFMLAYIIRELDRLRSDVKKISKKIGGSK